MVQTQSPVSSLAELLCIRSCNYVVAKSRDVLHHPLTSDGRSFETTTPSETDWYALLPYSTFNTFNHAIMRNWGWHTGALMARK